MSFSDVDTVYIILMIAIGLVVFVFLMAALWRWVFKIDQQIKNQEELIRLLRLQCKLQGASEKEIEQPSANGGDYITSVKNAIGH